MSWKLLLVSDTHQEHNPLWTADYELPEHDGVLAPGDIDSPPAKAIRWMNYPAWKFFGNKPIFYCAGNHEYYGGIIEDREAEAEAEAAKPGSRVRWCNADRVHYLGDLRILGLTMWTDYRVGGNAIRSMQAAMSGMNDHRLIGTRDPDYPNPQVFQPRHALARNKREMAWLVENLEQPHDGPTLIMSHHGCTPHSSHPRFAGDPLNASFTSDYREIIERYQPAAWVHGHTHDSHDYRIGATRVICNPKGYGPAIGGARPENPDFNEQMIIEIPDHVPTPRMR